MSFIPQLLRLGLMVLKSPLTGMIFTAVTKKPFTQRGVTELVTQTHSFQKAQQHAERAIKGAVETAKFDPRNPTHFKHAHPGSADPVSVHLKSLKSAFTAASDAIKEEAGSPVNKPPVAAIRSPYARPSAPITRRDRQIDV